MINIANSIAWKRLSEFIDQNKSALLAISSVLAGTLILCVPAFYNGYPFVFPDIGAYIENFPTAIRQQLIPADRPLSYSLLFVSGLYRSLWPPLFVQSFLVACLLYVCVASLIDRNPIDTHVSRVFLFIVLFLLLFSSIAWTATHLLPDAFAGIIVLTVGVMSVYRSSAISKRMRVLIASVTIWMIMTHGSYMLLVPVMVSLLGVVWLKVRLLAKWIKPLRTMIPVLRTVSWRYLLAIAILPWVFSPLFNLAISGKWQYVEKSAVFLTARLFETGVAQQWLQEHCPASWHVLCPYRTHITDSENFIWGEDGPIQRAGGWIAVDTDAYKEINKGVLTTPRYAALFVRDSIRETGHLIFLHDLLQDRRALLGEHHYIYRIIRDRLKNDFPAYTHSKQNQNQLAVPLRMFAIINGVVSIISSGILLFFFVVSKYRSRLSARFRLLILWGVSGVLLNAFICASISGAFSRYNTRVIWLLPFFAVLCIIMSVMHRKNTSTSDDVVVSTR